MIPVTGSGVLGLRVVISVADYVSFYTRFKTPSGRPPRWTEGETHPVHDFDVPTGAGKHDS